MPERLRLLLQPMNLAGLCTLLAVALSLRWVPAENAVLAWSLLAVFTVLFLCHEVVAARRPLVGHGLLVMLPLLALVLVWLSPRIGTAQVLLVIWTAVIAMTWPPRVA